MKKQSLAQGAKRLLDAAPSVEAHARACDAEIAELEKRIVEIRTNFVDSLREEWDDDELKQAGF